MKAQSWLRFAAVAATAACAAAAAPAASADAVYHTEHLDLTAVAGAPLRSGFVQNIKAEGPQIYAREVFVLNGAVAGTTYTVTRNFFLFDPACAGSGFVFRSDLAVLETNAAGNAQGDVVVAPEAIPPFLRGDHGVFWTVRDAAGAVAYQTSCTRVTLD